MTTARLSLSDLDYIINDLTPIERHTLDDMVNEINKFGDGDYSIELLIVDSWNGHTCIVDRMRGAAA